MATCTLSIFTKILNNLNQKTGEETYFKIKKSTKMQKVFDTYAQRKGVQASSLRFLLDGDRIQPDQTPKQLELDDQDQIDCMLEQSGGIWANWDYLPNNRQSFSTINKYLLDTVFIFSSEGEGTRLVQFYCISQVTPWLHDTLYLRFFIKLFVQLLNYLHTLDRNISHWMHKALEVLNIDLAAPRRYW